MSLFKEMKIKKKTTTEERKKETLKVSKGPKKLKKTQECIFFKKNKS